MLGIDRYILRQLAVAMVLVTIGLSAILWLTQSLRFIEMTVNRGSSVGMFVELTLLVLPNFMSFILPVALFAVVLFTYNKLITDRELVVMRAAGISHMALARPALILAAVTMLFNLLLNVWLIPLSVQRFHHLQDQLRSATSSLLQEGTFNQIAPNLTVYVGAKSPKGELLNVIVHDRRNPRRTVTIMAERGALLKGPTEDSPPSILLINGIRQQVAPNSTRLSLLYFDNYAMQFSNDNKQGAARDRDPRGCYLDELFGATEASLGPVTYREYQVEGHQRLASPLYQFTFALLAAASLLAGWFNRRGQGDRLILAIGLMIGVQALSLVISNLATRHLALIPLLYITPVVVALAALAALTTLRDGTPLWRRFAPR
ncbi:putative permease YjgP/YjgQ family protein [mine drainage metagenome]|uniref:Putative permease YjgP/YjgQ family protein n=1 Tax=mine drainage metagenome TaxID=410659 RepID=A0A1J5SCH9_9ZZZZ